MTPGRRDTQADAFTLCHHSFTRAPLIQINVGEKFKYIKMVSITSFCSETANKDSLLLINFKKYTLREGGGLL